MTKILVIEDEEYIRDEVMSWLQFEDFEVFGAANGNLGLQLVYRENPDLILCDVAMPEMDGHTVLIEVRSNPDLSHTPFVFLTAAADRDSMRKGMDMGADDYLTKPFTHAEVLNTVQSRLEKKYSQVQQVQTQLNTLTRALDEEHEQRLLKSRLVAMFSHDFRNPLTTILSSSGLLQNYDDRLSPERKQQHFKRIEGAVHLLIQMLDEMLMVAEMESGYMEFSPQLMDISNFIGAIVEEFRIIDQDAHILRFESAQGLSVQADPKLLRHIVSNLVSNALKYSPAGTEICIGLHVDSDRITVEVQDHGIGIPEDSMPKLFEPFHRASNAKKIKGTGLGLSVVKNCVERHNGKIGVDSVVDKGTRFVVEIPRIST
ncbi:MAG: hybrid sensor histidine kinase/response regulator [Anaerolineae bacterium]